MSCAVDNLDSAEAALKLGVLRSTQRRSAVLAAVLFAGAVPVALFTYGPRLAFSRLDPGLLARLLQATPWILACLLAVAFAELIAWKYLGRCLRSASAPPAWLPPLQTTAESLLPTMILVAVMPVLGLVDTMAGALPWLYFPVIALSAFNLSLGLSCLAGFVAAAGFVLVAESALWTVDTAAEATVLTVRFPYYVKAVLLAGTGVLTALVARGLRRHLVAAVQTAAERDRAVSIFGQHVSPEVAERLLHQPVSDAGESRYVCVLFLDIRGFSDFAAGRPATEVMAYLNSLFGRLIDVVNVHQGIVNKFLGDGFMAVFGAPADDSEAATHAARCALALLDATDGLCAAGTIPPTRLGIGLHVGSSVTGNVGAATRKEYTVIGDTVNIAARIEQATKSCSAQLLVSDDVWRALPAAEFRGDDLGPIELKGQPQPVRLHRLR